MTRHRWVWRADYSGVCKHCGAATKLVSRKKIKGAGRTSERAYSRSKNGVYSSRLPKCVEKS